MREAASLLGLSAARPGLIKLLEGRAIEQVRIVWFNFVISCDYCALYGSILC